MIKLTMVITDGAVGVDQEDEDGLPVTGPATAGQSCPVMVDRSKVRCFYPRKEGRRGTRLTFDNSAGMAVTEPFEEVARLFSTH